MNADLIGTLTWAAVTPSFHWIIQPISLQYKHADIFYYVIRVSRATANAYTHYIYALNLLLAINGFVR